MNKTAKKMIEELTEQIERKEILAKFYSRKGLLVGTQELNGLAKIAEKTNLEIKNLKEFKEYIETLWVEK